MGQLDNYMRRRSTVRVHGPLGVTYGRHIAGTITKGDSVLTLDEAAEILRLSSETVVKLFKAGRIHAVRTGGHSGKWRISRSAIDEFLRGES